MHQQYDPAAARAQAKELKATQIEQTRKAEKEKEESLLRTELAIAEETLARFETRLLAHTNSGYTGSIDWQSWYIEDKLKNIASNTVEVEVFLRFQPSESQIDGQVYSKYDSLNTIVRQFQEVPTEFRSHQLLINKLFEHPRVVKVLRGILDKGLEPVIGERIQYGHEGGYEGRSFHDWSGIYILAKLPEDTPQSKWWKRQRKAAETSLKKRAEQFISDFPQRAVHSLALNLSTMQVADLHCDRTGFNHRTNHQFRADNNYSYSLLSYEYGGKENAQRVISALRADPYYGTLLKGLEEIGLKPKIINGKISVKI